MHYEFHEFSSMFPLLEGAEFDELVADIERNGQRELIVLLDNKILDGRNRYRACEKLGQKPRLREFQCVDGDPLAYVWSENFIRRHLNTSQAGLAIVMRNEFLEKGDVKSQKTNALPIGRPLSVQEAAQLAKTSTRTIERAKTVKKHAKPEEIKSIINGERTIYDVESDIKKRTTYVGPKISCPKGVTLEQLTRQGLDLENNGMTPELAAKNIGASLRTYRAMREMVMLVDREDLSTAEAKLAKEAVQTLNETRQLQGYESVKPIIYRIWGGGKESKNSRTETKRKEEFEHAINAITYPTLASIDIPQLTKDKAEMIVEELEDSIQRIRKLIEKIKEIYLK